MLKLIKLVRTTPSSIAISDGDKHLVISGESFAQGYGSPDFVIFRSSVQSWTTPEGVMAIDEEEKAEVLRQVVDELERRKWVVAVE